MRWGAQPAARCGTKASDHSSPGHHVQFLGGAVRGGTGKRHETWGGRAFCTVIKIKFWKLGVSSGLLSAHPDPYTGLGTKVCPQ